MCDGHGCRWGLLVVAEASVTGHETTFLHEVFFWLKLIWFTGKCWRQKMWSNIIDFIAIAYLLHITGGCVCVCVFGFSETWISITSETVGVKTVVTHGWNYWDGLHCLHFHVWHRPWLRSVHHTHHFICQILNFTNWQFCFLELTFEHFSVVAKRQACCKSSYLKCWARKFSSFFFIPFSDWNSSLRYCLQLCPLHCYFLYVTMRATIVPGHVASIKRFLPLPGVYWQCQEANGSTGREEVEIHMASHECRQSTGGWKTTHTAGVWPRALLQKRSGR